MQHGLIGFKLLSAGLATISLIGSGVGIGVIFGCLMVAVARNPFIIKQLFSYAILGFALTEAIALSGSMTAFPSSSAFQVYKNIIVR